MARQRWQWRSAALAVLLALAGCGGEGGTPVEPGQRPPEVVIAPGEVGGFISVRTDLFHQYELDRARASGQRFPAYRLWLSALTSAVRSGGPAPAAGTTIVDDAQAELRPFLSPMPHTHDLETLAAIQEQTALASLGRILVDAFKDQSSATRSAAADAIAADIRID